MLLKAYSKNSIIIHLHKDLPISFDQYLSVCKIQMKLMDVILVIHFFMLAKTVLRRKNNQFGG